MVLPWKRLEERRRARKEMHSNASCCCPFKSCRIFFYEKKSDALLSRKRMSRTLCQCTIPGLPHVEWIFARRIEGKSNIWSLGRAPWIHQGRAFCFFPMWKWIGWMEKVAFDRSAVLPGHIREVDSMWKWIIVRRIDKESSLFDPLAVLHGHIGEICIVPFHPGLSKVLSIFVYIKYLHSSIGKRITVSKYGTSSYRTSHEQSSSLKVNESLLFINCIKDQ